MTKKKMMMFLKKLNNRCKKADVCSVPSHINTYNEKNIHLFTSTCPAVNGQLECRLWVSASDTMIMLELCYSPRAVFDCCICNWYKVYAQMWNSSSYRTRRPLLFLLSAAEGPDVPWRNEMLMCCRPFEINLRGSFMQMECCMCQQEKGCETEFRKLVPSSAPVFLLFHFSGIQMLLWCQIITLNWGHRG